MVLWVLGLRKGAEIIGCLDYGIITERTEMAETYGNGLRWGCEKYIIHAILLETKRFTIRGMCGFE